MARKVTGMALDPQDPRRSTNDEEQATHPDDDGGKAEADALARRATEEDEGDFEPDSDDDEDDDDEDDPPPQLKKKPIDRSQMSEANLRELIHDVQRSDLPDHLRESVASTIQSLQRELKRILQHAREIGSVSAARLTRITGQEATIRHLRETSARRMTEILDLKRANRVLRMVDADIQRSTKSPMLQNKIAKQATEIKRLTKGLEDISVCRKRDAQIVSNAVERRTQLEQQVLCLQQERNKLQKELDRINRVRPCYVPPANQHTMLWGCDFAAMEQQLRDATKAFSVFEPSWPEKVEAAFKAPTYPNWFKQAMDRIFREPGPPPKKEAWKRIWIEGVQVAARSSMRDNEVKIEAHNPQIKSAIDTTVEFYSHQPDPIRSLLQLIDISSRGLRSLKQDNVQGTLTICVSPATLVQCSNNPGL